MIGVPRAVVYEHGGAIVHQAQGIERARLSKAAIYQDEVVAAARGRDRLYVRA